MNGRRCAARHEATGGIVDYTDRLRLLAISSAQENPQQALGPSVLDPKTRAIARLAALISCGGAAAASYGAFTDEALASGATPDEIVDVLVDLIPVVGLPRAVAAAPCLALALGYDVDQALE